MHNQEELHCCPALQLLLIFQQLQTLENGYDIHQTLTNALIQTVAAHLKG